MLKLLNIYWLVYKIKYLKSEEKIFSIMFEKKFVPYIWIQLLLDCELIIYKIG